MGNMAAKLTLVGTDHRFTDKQGVVAQGIAIPGAVTRSDGENIRYVEDKQVDMSIVASFLEESQKANHWTNFGPLSRRLENEIAERLLLDDDLRVVMCASGSAAMHALINMHETLAGKKLRWVTSSFGFYSSIQGSLQDAEIIDCDKNALLDLKKLDPKNFDGLVVTNTFGQEADLTEYYRYAATHGKIVCVDSALAFGSHLHGANECISFHHTKPWGFGEGGCAIVAAEHEELFRSLINFGHTMGHEINRRAINGKISDVACAFSLARMQQMQKLDHDYLEQYNRIVDIGDNVGLDILANAVEHPGVPASVPFLAPLPLQDFKHSVLPTGRYYRPLADTPIAKDIYSRIINVPCHGDMAKLSDKDIRNALESLINRCFY